MLESTTTQLLTLLSRALFPRYACWFLHHIADLLLGGTAANWASAAAGSTAASASCGPGGSGFAAASGATSAAVAVGGTVGGSAMPPGPRQVRAALLLLRCLFRVQGIRLGPAAALLVADGTLLQPVVALTAGPMSAMAMETLTGALQLSQDEQFQRDLQEGVARTLQYEQQQQHAAAAASRTLFPPPTPVAAALKKVVDTLGSSLRRRNKHMKLLPFLGVYND
ncbi:hypothetical protein Vafri_2235 [Volvox africanus]|nr:hypothetical protein Vafri_2235 [Volvox africanus]